MMDLQQFFQSVAENLQTSAHVKTVYGEPIVTEGKTVVPVAKVSYGFGGGHGRKRIGAEQGPGEEGSGGGAGIKATPVGVVEITAAGTRFIRFGQTQKLAAALLAGYVFGRFCGRRR
ncbi:MAG: hypothetical protein M1436_02255 [Acidobacteria bacterium]|nr:hypothetical protein [Acidobacteriota bacterium]